MKLETDRVLAPADLAIAAPAAGWRFAAPMLIEIACRDLPPSQTSRPLKKNRDDRRQTDVVML